MENAEKSENAIEIRNLEKRYGNQTVLSGLNFSVRKGETFALLGTNGAGKTTTLECIEGLKKYDGGKINVNGKIGIQLQSASLPSHIKAIEAVKLFSKWNKPRNKTNKAEKANGKNVLDDEILDLLDSLGINEFAKKQYRQLSTGQKRRLHLVLALTRNPEILFLDEPTAGLDVEGRISLHEQIRKLKTKGKTIVLASHDMSEVENLCDRIAILSSGKIAFIGTVSELNQTVGKHFNIRIQTETEMKGKTESEMKIGAESEKKTESEIRMKNGTENEIEGGAESKIRMENGDERGIKTEIRTEEFESDDIAETLLSKLADYKANGRTVLDIQINRGSLEQHFMKIAKIAKEKMPSL